MLILFYFFYILNFFFFFNFYFSIFKGKFIVLVKLLHEIHTQTNEKVVLISNYTQTLDIYEEMCKIYHYTYIRLDG